MATLPEASRLLIFEEEVRAWTNGCRLAQEVGFLDAQAYDAEASRALRFYREKVFLPSTAPAAATAPAAPEPTVG